MSDRWVIPGLFKVFAGFILWDRERELLHHEGPVFFTNQPEKRVHLRWIVNPGLGLSRHPFQVFTNPEGPGGVTDPQQLANQAGWELVEVVGLPVDTGDPNVVNFYDDGFQGLARPDPADSPMKAAERRLEAGAPHFGWSTLSKGIASMPDWQPPSLDDYLKDLVKSRLFGGLMEMLDQHRNPLEQADVTIVDQDSGATTRLSPRLLVAPNSPPINKPARTGWHPLGLLALSTGSDPFSSLALGFGTALDGKRDSIYMVSVLYEVTFMGQDFKFELADVVTIDDSLRAPAAPTGLAAGLLSHSRPATTDGPAVESIQASWDRPERPENAPNAKLTTLPPASYAVGRFGPLDRQAEILLEPRPSGGWLPFAASRPKTESQVSFVDHLIRQTTIGNPVVQIFGDPLPVNLTYAVAAQDLFGRWTGWQTIDTSLEMEPKQGPAILAAQLDPSGALRVDFAWDWSDRSPEFIELKGAFEDAPASLLFEVLLDFKGNPQPATPPAPAVVQPLALLPPEPEGPLVQLAQPPQPQSLSVIGSWGQAQDRNPADPSTRYYRLSLQIPFSFNGRSERTLLVQGRGQCHIQQLLLPGSNISDFGNPARVTLFDPQPPLIRTPEAPQWASLPDVNGVSRALLDWRSGAAPGAAGYVVYEATETTLLSALGLPGPDLTQPFTQRLQVLRQQNLGGLQSKFRRLEPSLIKDATYEVALPRGSSVMHFYAVTAMSSNQVESDWPQNPKSFIAVAAPRLATPPAPALKATPSPQAGTVTLEVGLPEGGPPVSKVVLYRTTSDKLSAAGVDSFGPPIVTPPPVVNGKEQSFTDVSAPSGWQRIFYRAVAWTADNLLTGEVGARSQASAPQSVLLPPNTLPDLQGLQVNLPGSTLDVSLVSWTSSSPVANTALGPHTTAVEASDEQGNPPIRLSERLDKLPALNSLADLPAPVPGAVSIFRLAVPKGQPAKYLAWAPRPVIGQPSIITVKVVDPLGRISSASVAMPALPLPELGPVTIQPVTAVILPPPHWKVVRWDILSIIEAQQAANYNLGVELVAPGVAQPAHIHAAFSNIQEVDETPQRLIQDGLVGTILRATGRQGPFQCAVLVNVDHAHIKVTLTDPLGRTAMQVAAF
jgi:hypothetical protein